MRASFWWWIGWFLVLFVLDFVIPFHYLSEVPRLAGSFLFWMVWVLVAIASMFVLFMQWRDDEKSS